MVKVFWEKQYSIGINSIDEQHKRIIDFLNRVYDRAENIVPPEEVKNLLNDIEAHAEEHFAYEEKYFDLFHYEGADEHKSIHRKMATDILGFKEKYELNRSQHVLIELVEFLENWLFVHIMQYDKKYTKCFREHGLV